MLRHLSPAELAAAAGDIESFGALDSRSYITRAASTAAEHGHFEFLGWLRRHRMPNWNNRWRDAAVQIAWCGAPAALAWFETQFPRHMRRTRLRILLASYAVKASNLAVVEWLVSRCPKIVRLGNLFSLAAAHCQPRVVDWFWRNAQDDCFPCGKDVARCAIARGDVWLLNWLSDRGQYHLARRTAIRRALKAGQTDSLAWLGVTDEELRAEGAVLDASLAAHPNLAAWLRSR